MSSQKLLTLRRSISSGDSPPEYTSAKKSVFTEMFATPGSGLIGDQKAEFENIRARIVSCTDPSLPVPDLNLNNQCVRAIKHLINTSSSPMEVLTELQLFMSKRLLSKNAKVDLLVLSLLELLMAKCGELFHQSLNNDFSMRVLSKVVYYHKMRLREEHQEVYVLAADVIQSWGEAFYPVAKHYQHIVDLYLSLQRDRGLPRRKQDDLRDQPKNDRATGSLTDGSLAIGHALSGNGESTNTGARRFVFNESSLTRRMLNEHNETMQKIGTPLPMGLSVVKLRQRSNIQPFQPRGLTRIQNAAQLLKDLVLGCNTADELRANDLAFKVQDDLRKDYKHCVRLIEREVADRGPNLPALMLASDLVSTSLELYDSVVTGKLMMKLVRQLSGSHPHTPPTHLGTKLPSTFICFVRCFD